MFPLLEIVGITSTEKTYSVRFSFMVRKKREFYLGFRGVCQEMLKNHEEKVFPISYAVGSKHIECEDGKMVKVSVI